MEQQPAAVLPTSAPGPPQVAAAARPGRRSWVLALQAGDFALSLVSYYLLRLLGASVWVAVVAPSLVTIALVVWRWARRRTIDRLNLLVLAVLVSSVAISTWSGSPEFLFAKGAVFTGAMGVAFVVSLGLRRPLALVLTRTLLERLQAPTRDWDEVWDGDPRFRRTWRVCSLWWAGALLLDAVAIVLIAYRLPIDAVPAAITGVRIVSFVVVQGVTNVYLAVRGTWRQLDLDIGRLFRVGRGSRSERGTPARR